MAKGGKKGGGGVGKNERTYIGGSGAPSRTVVQTRPVMQLDVVDWVHKNPRLALKTGHPKEQAAPGGIATLPGRSKSNPV